MQIVDRRMEDIHPYENNPRINDGAVDAVAASIREFGFKVPIVVDANGEIVAGHTRYKAAKMLDYTSVPCIVADDLTPEQVQAFRLADNKTASLSDWDFDALRQELDALESVFDMTEFGFDGQPEPENEEPLDLDNQAQKEQKTIQCHCPKCGLVFEQKI